MSEVYGVTAAFEKAWQNFLVMLSVSVWKFMTRPLCAAVEPPGHIDSGAVIFRTASAFLRVVRVAMQRAILACISGSSSPITLQAL